ncbi:NAD(+) synthase [Acetanaerobacterium elongatum]|uniref:Glutamine-dependent NAD(+) synthetase n=1 Tax=Acetanaerobacterium elongatum TaxID=258515 RepID=A0A1H0B3M0_9FIRM|nr:NAD(+) synthase [Acetanaerobacterium elongatum]SDN40227.1 NAD+ synthase (glutamine-hydrolysing) [Acetanaerobacterium elongatum]
MKHGFIKVGTATPHIRVADCDYNTQQIIAQMKEAAAQGVKLLVFPELCITGYTCGDLFLQNTLLAECLNAIEDVCNASAGMDMLTIAGAPVLHDGKLFNTAIVFYNGVILGVVPKTNLPNYSEFYEQRHFSEPNGFTDTITLFGQEIPFGAKQLFVCSELPEFCLGVEICEDIWVPAPPSQVLALAGATVIANLSASDETIGKDNYRRALVSGQSARLLCGYLYADAGDGESSTDMVFAGHNLIAENGIILKESRLFQNGLITTELDVGRLSYDRRRMTSFPFSNGGCQKVFFSMPPKETTLTRPVDRHPFVPSARFDRNSRSEAILLMQSQGLKTRLEHSKSKTVVVGISGGLDSSLALLVAARAMDMLGRPHSDIVAVTMPCFGTTKRTRSNAEQLCMVLGVNFKCVDITESVKQHFADIGHDIDNHDVVYENAQARIRTLVLMDLANQTDGIVLGTGDLSELALGWATYNGDHMSMYAVNASVPKTLIRHIVRFAADTAEDEQTKQVLYDILDTPVSPELLPAKDDKITQETEQLVGPYELHDFFLYYVVRFGFSPSKVFRLAAYAFNGDKPDSSDDESGYDRETILKWLRVFYTRFFAQQFKRSCLPDGPKIGSVTLSPRSDWRMPSDASVALWLKELDTLK